MKKRSSTCRAPGRLLFPPRHVSLSGFFFRSFSPWDPESCSASALIHGTWGAFTRLTCIGSFQTKKNQTARSEDDEDEAGFFSSFLTRFPPGRLLDMTESRAATVGRKNARSSVRSSLTPRWKLQQASLKENEMIASLKVCKQRQTSSTVILTPSISNGLASLCHVGRHMSLSLSLSPYRSQPRCTLIVKVANRKHKTIDKQWLTLTWTLIMPATRVNFLKQ